MAPLVAAPCVKEGDERQSSGVHRQSGTEAMTQVIDADVIPAHSDFSFIYREERSDWKGTQRMLHGSPKEQQVGSTEPIIRIARQHGRAVDVGAADGRREIKGNMGSAARERL